MSPTALMICYLVGVVAGILAGATAAYEANDWRL